MPSRCPARVQTSNRSTSGACKLRLAEKTQASGVGGFGHHGLPPAKASTSVGFRSLAVSDSLRAGSKEPIDARSPESHEALRRAHGGAGPLIRGSAWRGAGTPGSERIRQEHDGQDPDRAAAAHQRHVRLDGRDVLGDLIATRRPRVRSGGTASLLLSDRSGVSAAGRPPARSRRRLDDKIERFLELLGSATTATRRCRPTRKACDRRS